MVPEGEDGRRRQWAGRLADEFVRSAKSFEAVADRRRIAAARLMERSAYRIAAILAVRGPMRIKELAGEVRSDVSTVSRQVAALVRRDLLVRVTDDRDGRSALLELTEAGREAYAEHRGRRLQFFLGVTATWPTTDMEDFHRLLSRFTDDMDGVVAGATDTPDHSRGDGPRSEGPIEMNEL